MGNTKPISRLAKAGKAISISKKEDEHCFILGLEGAGKTHLLYRMLAGGTEGDLQPTLGFNCENYVSESCDFFIWDIGGSARVREFWPFYTKQINPKVIVFVLNGNECIMRLREAQRVLHWVMADPFVENSELMIVVNTRPNPAKLKQEKNKEDEGGKKQKATKEDSKDKDIWVEYDLTTQQLIKLLKLCPKHKEKQ